MIWPSAGERTTAFCSIAISAAALVGTSLIGVAGLIDFAPRLIWNLSPSLPLGLYRVVEASPKLGEVAVVDPPEWVKLVAEEQDFLPRSVLLMKPVVAVAGDHVCRQGISIFVNGVKVAVAHTYDLQGRLLPSWRGCHRLGGDDLFLLSQHSWSFDGRYFGPVKVDRVIGRAHPLWTGSS